MSDYTHEGQQRILKLLLLLSGHEMTGIAPAAIARQQACSASLVTRDLDNLRTAGLAEKVPETSDWRLAPGIVQVAMRHMAAMDRAERRLVETRQRFSRSDG